MDEQGIAWFEELKRHVTECRKQRPLVDRSDLSLAEEMQCRVIGDSSKKWLSKQWPKHLEQRISLVAAKGWSKEPYIVFTSNQPGLIAALEIFVKDTPGNQGIAFLYPDEFADWHKSHPDNNYEWHAHFWSGFRPLNPRLLKEHEKSIVEKYPLNPEETYWIHDEGTICGKLFGRGSYRLWKWNGVEPVLLGSLGG